MKNVALLMATVVVIFGVVSFIKAIALLHEENRGNALVLLGLVTVVGVVLALRTKGGYLAAIIVVAAIGWLLVLVVPGLAAPWQH